MFEVMKQSSGKLLGVDATGVIRKQDYDELVPICEKIINEEGSMSMLIDMKGFRLEAPSAWRDDFHFGREFHHKIERMAIVGDRWWEEWMTAFCRHFYAHQAKYFRTYEIDAAWDWLKEGQEQAA